MNKDTRGTINCRENRLKESLLACLPVLLYLRIAYLWGKLEQHLNRGAIVLTIFT